MRIVVDRSRCQGLGMCETFSPEIFEVGEDGALVLHCETVPDGAEAEVQQAVENCPTEALSVHD